MVRWKAVRIQDDGMAARHYSNRRALDLDLVAVGGRLVKTYWIGFLERGPWLLRFSVRAYLGGLISQTRNSSTPRRLPGSTTIAADTFSGSWKPGDFKTGTWNVPR